MSWGTPTGNDAIVIPKEALPRLVALMIETRAAAAMASLTGSAMYRTAGEACAGLAHVAVQMSRATLRRLNEQMMPALIRVILDGSRDDDFVRLARIGIPSSCTDELVSGMPALKVTALEANAPETDIIRYVWERNTIEISADVKRRKAKALSQLAADMRRKEDVPPAWDLDKDEQKRLVIFNKDRRSVLSSLRAQPQAADPSHGAGHGKERCASCRLVLSKANLKRCSRCRVATYCSVACQKEEWSEHRKICKQT